MHKNILLTAILFLFIITAFTARSQKTAGNSPVKWYKPAQAEKISKEQGKPILINFYTDWCSWCKRMMKTTFASESIAAYINGHFVPVRFNAEGNDTVTFQGKTYTNPGKGRKPKHEFADEILEGRFTFPTLVYIVPGGKKFPVPGYQNVKNIEPYLIYFAEKVYINLPLDHFISDYIFSFPGRFEEEIEKIKKQNPEFVPPDTSGLLKTYSLQQAEKLSKKNKKPMFIIMSVSWCNSCQVLEKITLRNPATVQRLNRDFYTVRFDAASRDAQKFLGQTFEAGQQAGHPHQLTRALLKKSFLFPAFVAVNSENQIITELHGYLHSSQLSDILEYYTDNTYKKMSYQDFIKQKTD